MLLGKDQVEPDPIRRIIHCTEFYKAALKLFRARHGLDRFTDLMYCHIAIYIMDNYDDIQPTWDTLAEWTSAKGATQLKDGQKVTGVFKLRTHRFAQVRVKRSNPDASAEELFEL